MADNDKKIILHVEDNEAARYITSKLLRQAGFEVKEAACGMDALRLLKGKVDLVILDLKLQDIDGFEVCRKAK